MANIIFIHGFESSGQGFKGRFLKNLFPEIITPDFIGSLEERMNQLRSILDEKEHWILIGSSYGGLMAASYACQNPTMVSFLILLAPLLVHPELRPGKYPVVNVPVVIYHGKKDNVVLMEPTRARARKLFANMDFNVMNDDHMLHPTVEAIDWPQLIKRAKYY